MYLDCCHQIFYESNKCLTVQKKIKSFIAMQWHGGEVSRHRPIIPSIANRTGKLRVRVGLYPRVRSGRRFRRGSGTCMGKHRQLPWPLFRGRIKVTSTIALHSMFSILETVRERSLVPKNHQMEMAYGLSIRMVTWTMTSRDLERSY